MSDFALINKNVVIEIIPEFNPIFPNVPVSERYPADIVQKMIAVSDGINVHVGMVYDPETGTFAEPIAPPPVPADLDELKAAKIEESKTKLAEWLINNPLLYQDGKYYSVTEEKQSLLNGNIASYERAEALSIGYTLKWNSTGEECCLWAYDDLVTLSLAIAGYVAPKVSKQQQLEVQIRNCETVEELDAIVIDYDE